MNNIHQINNNFQSKPSEPKYISQNDFIYFKNELLKDLKTIEVNILSKVKTATDQYDTKLLNMDSKINSCRSKMMELNSSISSDKSHLEKVNKLFVFKVNAEDKISSHDKRLKEITEYFNESLYSMNKIIQENINYPGVIGLNSKFANFHAFVDFAINNINTINMFKEKMISSDMQNFKTKLDKIMKSYKAQIDTFISSSKNLATETLVIYDNKVNELLRVFEDKIEKERNNFQKDLDEFKTKFEDLNTNVNSLKNELMNKIGSYDDQNEKKFTNLNSKYDKNFSEIEFINKKIEEINESIKKLILDFEDKEREQEYRILSKINHFFSGNSFSKSGQKNFMDNSFKKMLDKEFLNNYNIKPIEQNIPAKETIPIESRLKKYIEGEISINEILSNRDKKTIKRQNSSNGNSGIDTDRRNKIKAIESEAIPYINNIKFIKFHNEAIKNNKENGDNKLFMSRKKVDSYIIEKENVIINKVPRKQIIKNLLQGSSEPISIYLKQNKEERKNIINKIRTHQKITLTANRKLDNSFKNRFHNSNSQFFQKKKSEDGNSIDNNELLEDLNEINNKRTFSSGSKTRNNEQNSMRQNSIMGYNTTEILKDNNNNSKNKDNNDDEDNNLKIINNEIFNNKEDDYNKKKNKIINNFNSASKLFDLNVKNENLIKSKYKLLNPLHKNLKIIKSPTNQYSRINHELKLKNDKDKEKIKRHSIHYYFSAKNKNT